MHFKLKSNCERSIKPLRLALLLAGLLFFAASADAQLRPQVDENLDCQDVTTLAKMAEARTSVELAVLSTRASGGYLAETVLMGRTFQLHHDREFAIRLLNLIPRNQEQHEAWMALREPLCRSESAMQRATLTTFHDRLSTDLAQAAVMVPTMLQHYVAYALVATTDPKDDYAIPMQKVCRMDHEAFLGAVNQLPLERRNEFNQRVFDTPSCRANALPTGGGTYIDAGNWPDPPRPEPIPRTVVRRAVIKKRARVQGRVLTVRTIQEKCEQQIKLKLKQTHDCQVYESQIQGQAQAQAKSQRQ